MARSLPNRRNAAGRASLKAIASCAAIAGFLLCACAARAQAPLSLSDAVELALRNNPRVLGAQDEVRRQQALLAQSHDAYVPSVSAGTNVGQAYGYLPYPPTLFQANAGSLIYSASQRYYIGSARAGVKAAEMTLKDVGETAAQDTALAFLALNHDSERAAAIHQQLDYGNRLAAISQDRFNAGQDSKIDLTQAQLTAAQMKLAALRADDEIANDRDHLARLIGVPSASLRIDSAFPTAPMPQAPPTGPYANAGVAAAFFSAQARQQQAKGDAKVRFWPNVELTMQYQRYATFTDSFKNLGSIYKGANNQTLLTSNSFAIGIQATLPFLDKTRSDKARETAAEAGHATHDAQSAEIDALDGQSKLRHSIAELDAQGDVANLQQQLAQQQLEVLQQQLQAGTGNPNGPQMTPKDEQNARIDERNKYIAVLDATFNLRQAEIQLLRQTGQLITWIDEGKTTPSAPTPNLPAQTTGPARAPRP